MQSIRKREKDSIIGNEGGDFMRLSKATSARGPSNLSLILTLFF